MTQINTEKLNELSDPQFEELRELSMAEQIRRNRMREIPNEVASLRAQYESAGGTTEQLIDKLNEPVPTPEVESEASIEAPADDPSAPEQE